MKLKTTLYFVLAVLLIIYVQTLNLSVHLRPSNSVPIGNNLVEFQCAYRTSEKENVLLISIQKEKENIATFYPPGLQQQQPVLANTTVGNSFRGRSRLSSPSFNDLVATLFVNNIKCADEGTYGCHITVFTREAGEKNFNQYVNLTTKAPAEEPSELKILSPHVGYEEGHLLTIVCIGNIGKPFGKIRWWLFRNEENVTELRSSTQSALPTVRQGQCKYNVTSFLTIRLKLVDDKAVVRCSVDQELLTSGHISDGPNKQTNPINMYFRVGTPAITKHPDKDIYISGETLTLRCSVTGNPNPTTANVNNKTKITWTFNQNGHGREISANDIEGVTIKREILEIGNLQEIHQGEYTCHAQNGFLERVYYSEEKITITVSMPSTTPFVIDEYDETVADRAGTHSTVSRILLICISFAHACFGRPMTGCIGLLMIIILLTHANNVESISISTNIQPSSTVPIGNSHVHFRCFFTLQEHESVISITWRRGRKDFQDIASFFPPQPHQQSPIFSSSDEGKSFKDRSSLSNPSREYSVATLSVNTIHCHDEGTYRCSIKLLNLSGTETKFQDVNLTITAPGEGPSLISVPSGNLGYEEGHSVTFSCTANVGKPLGNILWWINRKGSLTALNQTWLDTQKTLSTIPIVEPEVCVYNVTSYQTMILRKEDNVAMIRCDVDHVLFGNQTPVHKPNRQTNPLNVYFKIGKPQITLHPHSARYPVGTPKLTLQCHVTGNPNPATSDDISKNEFTWYYTSDEGVFITASDVNRVTVSKGTLTITNLASYHQGKYICMAKNGFNHKVYTDQNAVYVKIATEKVTSMPVINISPSINLQAKDSGITQLVAMIGVPVAVIIIVIVLCYLYIKRSDGNQHGPEHDTQSFKRLNEVEHNESTCESVDQRPCSECRVECQIDSAKGEHIYSDLPTSVRDNKNTEFKTMQRQCNCRDESQTESLKSDDKRIESEIQHPSQDPRENSSTDSKKGDHVYMNFPTTVRGNTRDASGNQQLHSEQNQSESNKRENAHKSSPLTADVREDTYDTIPADWDDAKTDQKGLDNI